jgi:hypothetical protein
VAALEDRPGDFDLVVTGLIIPGGTGLEVAEAAGRAGGLPVVLTAARGDQALQAGSPRRPGNIAAVVQKPLSTVILGRVVESALAGEAAGLDSPASA